MLDEPEPGLAARLRDGTSEAHRAAERGPFIRAFLGARRATTASTGSTGPTLDRLTYRDYLVALWAVYTALEAGLERHREHPIAGPLALPYLYRAPAIAADLSTLFAVTPEEQQPVPAALAYAERLRELADHDPALLVAHAYTRYLGDLSGGQILRGAAARILDIPAGSPGLAFYHFAQIPDLGLCKADLRARLDALPLAPAEVTALVAEARSAFARNAAVFAELLPT
ncbi:MAG: biliverdin-producing heme oxygenase [Nannocystis sp.]|nr:biliverdin-producing heme oxygenase [Nannocystis sp.]MBA3550139.1 biliverdin-producing heme oxygenase [Nannocystis sp.]